MTLYIIGHKFNYEMEKLCSLFFPHEKIKVEVAKVGFEPQEDFFVLTSLSENQVYTKIHALDNTLEKTTQFFCTDEKEIERLMAVDLFGMFVKLLDFTPKWGILTGVRPIKLFRRLEKEEGSTEKACDYFKNQLLVSDEKTHLATVTSKNEAQVIAKSLSKGFSLYISIPFCPTRCSYCSFVSQSVEKAKKLLPDYVKLLAEEIAYTGKLAKEAGIVLQTVYIGGGTPTILSAEQLDIIIKAVYDNFDTSSLLEFTVEAGRPDTITEEKLLTLKNNNVDRISINPQTFNDSVLEEIGRKHTAQQAYDAMVLAKKIGFKNINMDLIAGLPTDTVESFNKTLDTCFELDPESITVHTLSIKRASNLVYTGQAEYNSEGRTVSEMVDNATDRLFEKGYIPYYLYRQSRMLGNLENTGWSKPGYESLYNVYIMDETHTILACGAGGVTKLKQPDGPYIERIFNYKFPYEYINGFEELLKRKERIKTFYGEYC